MKQDNWRQKAFQAKFRSAAYELVAVSPRSLESLKLRGAVISPSQVHAELETSLGPLKLQPIAGAYQGRAWKLTDSEGNSLILVEHETGLEILYITGAVASIFSLVISVFSLVVNDRGRIRHHSPHFQGTFDLINLERRRLDPKGNLVEYTFPSIETFFLQYLSEQNVILSERVSSLENEVTKLKGLLGKIQKRPTSRGKVKRDSG